jgi:lipoate---protein ligase
MLNIINKNKDIFFNLALEEYLLRSCKEDIFMLWQSEASIVAGKHQNIMAEVNQRFAHKNNLRIARRLTGGGTVFHGPGNLNFTFIVNGEAGKMINFTYFVRPIVDFLAGMGIKAQIGKRNDVLIAGKKISGNAEHIFKTRVLHHGTLLFDANLKTLADSIKITPGRYFDKAIQSHPSEVGNILDYLPLKISIFEFSDRLEHFLMQRFAPTVAYNLTEIDLIEINRLRDQKYSKEEWIYGYSPNFYVKSGFKFSQEKILFKLDVTRGIITAANVEKGIMSGELELIFDKLIGEYYTYESLHQVLAELRLGNKLTDCFFNAIF